MTTFVHRDFSAGWCPSDSPLNGRPNGLLSMGGVELDQNGDLNMLGGTTILSNAYPYKAHTIFTKFFTNTQHRYAALIDGTINRENLLITAGGSGTRAAFGYAFNYVLAFSGNARVRDDGTTTNNVGQVKPVGAPILASAGAGILTGVYDYIQINVFANGAYIAKSAVGPAASITLTNENTNVTAEVPTSPANEVWIFRRGGNLDQYYRVKRLTSAYATLFVDNVSDLTALELGVTLNLNALSINSTDLPDAIFAIVGPINRRMLYFTKNTVFFSEINSPETYDPGRGLAYSDNTGGTEVFLWAKELDNNIVQIGTTHKRYILTGTYITLPDQSIDVDLRGIDSKFPPIGLGADVYNGGVAYMSASGWRIGYNSGNSELLVDERIDRLYRGNTLFNLAINSGGGIPIYPYPALDPTGVSIIYDCAVARDKLYCVMPMILSNNPNSAFGVIGHVYDFKRKYWRVGSSLGRVYAQEDGALVSFSNYDFKFHEIENQFHKTIDGIAGLDGFQGIELLFKIWDFGLPVNRKDILVLKFKAFTGASGFNGPIVKCSIDDGLTFVTLGTLNCPVFQETFFDLSTLVTNEIETPKTFQIWIYGITEDFVLSLISVEYEPRPNQTNYINVPRAEIPGVDGKKFRPRVWPLVIDTMGNNAIFTPYINGVAQPSLALQSSRKQLFNYFFKQDAPIPMDMGYKINSGSLFEFYGMLPPEIVQVFPAPKQFDQVGPEHFFRYGKIKKLIARILSESNGDIPYTIYFEDAAQISGVINVLANVENAYELGLPKTTAGAILRVELGPTSFTFYRYYMQFQVAKQGRDTDNEWVTVGVT